MNQDKGIGQLVLFSSGSTSNSTTRAVIPYMEQDGRFVCKMYYHAKATDTDNSDFDVETTPITSWLRVNNNEGNSVYWNKNFPDINSDGKVNEYDLKDQDREDANYKDYGFDPNAQFFYWRNRLNHIFLGYTDYNNLKGNKHGSEQGKLFMYPEYDGEKKTKTGTLESWPTVRYKQLKLGQIPNPEYNADDPGDVPATIFGLQGIDEDAKFPSFAIISMFPLTTTFDYSFISKDGINATYTKVKNYVNASSLSDDEKTKLTADLERIKDTDDEITSEGTFHFSRWRVYLNPQTLKFDDAGAIDFEQSEVCLLCEYQKQKLEDIIDVAPANTFDLTRGDKTSMAQQPDPLIALTKMKPIGATQEANRVRLYFKHQFSQIQVNLVNAENTAEITADRIVSVELLGVSKKGYVFTNINPNGTQIPPSYDPVIISQYTQDQLKENPYGTSFNMFDMGTAKPLTSLKSFNAIAFGQLQAIRITWKEEDYKDAEGNVVEEGIKHVATYKITVDDRNNSLVNLRSGYRYMYDFELRRGTIAFIRATIDGWQLSDDLNYNTSGTIRND